MLEANKRYAACFDKGGLPVSPARQVAIGACMDARLHPAALLEPDGITVSGYIRREHGRAAGGGAR